MKSILRTAAAGLAIASFGIASAASAATDTADVTAEILSTLTLNAVAADDTLDFGLIADNGLAASSTVAVSAAGVRTCGANLICSGTVDAPTFEITGLTGSSVAVSFPSASIPLTYSGTVPTGMTGTMTVSAFTTSLVGNQVTLVAGVNPFTVGGTLTVNQLQAPGVYTGSVTVEVLYN